MCSSFRRETRAASFLSRSSIGSVISAIIARPCRPCISCDTRSRAGRSRQLVDFDRPLSPRGRRNAALLAAHLREEAIEPELVLCSTARRARQTAEALGLGGVIYEDDLYGAGAAELAARLASLPASTTSAMLIAHNPGLEQLGHALGGEGQLRTAELWTFELEDWASGEGRLVERFLPRWSRKGHQPPRGLRGSRRGAPPAAETGRRL